VTTARPFSDRILACLKPPGGSNSDDLRIDDGALVCKSTGKAYPFNRGIPSLYQPSPHDPEEVTERIRSFYEEHPFPSYEGLEEFGELVNKGQSNPFTTALLSAVGFNKTVLECGCGTGQLTHFLQLNNNHTLGIDLSLSSLALAMEHKQRNELVRSSFAQMNIFDLAIKDSSFDVVISHGVLHHTLDARRAFGHIVKKVKPGGLVIVGLYNWYARVPTWIRARVIGVLGPRIDFVVRSRIRDERKAAIWIADQYFNPHESWHSIDEVMDWFRENQIEYLTCSPGILGTDSEDSMVLDRPTDPGTRYQRIVTQIGWLGSIAREGALFDLVGRRFACGSNGVRRAERSSEAVTSK
jgi:2-polyprenyl-3-methyl-5-hydroxy-6-metoxy-1,4-benzoquinol methylase